VLKYLIGILVVIALLVAAIVVMAGRPPADRRETQKQIDLTEFVDTPASVAHTREGRIVGEEEHTTIRITVNRNQRKIEHIRGYNGQVVNSLTYPNTQPAFDHFMHALVVAGFTAQQEPGHESHKGVCPFGDRFIYELIKDGRQITRSWSTSCRREDGNFAGRADQVRRLFTGQIPQYREFTRGLAP
jgi:hypothetical protein